MIDEKDLAKYAEQLSEAEKLNEFSLREGRLVVELDYDSCDDEESGSMILNSRVHVNVITPEASWAKTYGLRA